MSDRKAQTTVSEVLDVASAASTYGYHKDVVMDFFAMLLGYELSDEEIETHARTLGRQEGYGVEDYEECKENLTQFKATYFNSGRARAFRGEPKR